MSEYYYSLQKPGTYLDALSLRKRLEMLRMFQETFPDKSVSSVLDVGVTPDKTAMASNYFEHHYPDKCKITALSNLDASFLESEYPGLTFILGDACNLPLPDNSKQIVFSSAVIEHVGSYTMQKKMISECYRVAQSGVFITTPNRWYPVEFHTVLPFLHWLPKNLHRKILKTLGLDFYAMEQNLNLMDTKQLTQLCRELQLKRFEIKRIKTFGLTSNLVLIIHK